MFVFFFCKEKNYVTYNHDEEDNGGRQVTHNTRMDGGGGVCLVSIRGLKMVDWINLLNTI
jgi:hypothetical protein